MAAASGEPSFDCTEMDSGLEAHLSVTFEDVGTQTVILALPSLYDVQVAVGNRMANGIAPGSKRSIHKVSADYPEIQVIAYSTEGTINSHLIDRWTPNIDVRLVEHIEYELAISDEEVYIKNGTIQDDNLVDCSYDSNLCFHEYSSAQECANSILDYY